MGGDNTRDTFNQKKHYSSVRMQQGRVQLDADWNEQMDIQSYIDRTTTGDTIGLCGAPIQHAGFGLKCKNSDIIGAGCQIGDLIITKGRYYVDGILCECDEGDEEQEVYLANQDDLPQDALMVKLLDGTEKKLSEAPAGTYLGYLDAWERDITAIEDTEIRERALGGPDTAARKKSVWQVKLLQVKVEQSCKTLPINPAWEKMIQGSTGRMKAQTTGGSTSKNPCIVPSEARYLRLENQLYRVEVHKGGSRANATFKWSRDNGSVVTAIEKISGKKVTVQSTGKDAQSFASGQWVEILDDAKELKGEPGELGQIETVDIALREITMKTVPSVLAATADGIDKSLHPKLRRWDHDVDQEATKDGIKMKAASQLLEGGIAVQFTDPNSTYRTGDYWLIPARTAIGDYKGDIEWPLAPDDFQLPHGIKHHYCPLALLTLKDNKWTLKSDCRKLFPPMTELISFFYVSGDGQEADPKGTLPHELIVGVANGVHPVPGANIQWSVAGEGALTDSQVTTDPQGLARAKWTLGESGNQQVTATLHDSGGHALHLPVIFNAQFAQGQAAEPGIHVKEITFINGPLFQNGREFPAYMLAKGLEIKCDGELCAMSVESRPTGTDTHVSPTVYVTLDLPYPLNDADWKLWADNNQVVAYQPLILAGRVTVTGKGNIIEWKPAPSTSKCLNRLFLVIQEKKLDQQRILAHLTLKGNFIWNANADRYLDGEVFGTENKDRAGASFIGAKLPSGDKRLGGDLEVWFWLVQSKRVLLLGNPKHESFKPVSGENQKEVLSQAFNLAIDRSLLRQCVPAEFEVDVNQQPDVNEAKKLVNKFKLGGLEFNAWSEEPPFFKAITLMSEMVKPLPIHMAVDPQDQLLKNLSKAIEAGQAPAAVLVDGTLKDKFSKLGYDFEIVRL